MEDINAQMESAIESILNLKGCDEDEANSGGHTASNYAHSNGSEYQSNEMQADLALNEAIQSIQYEVWHLAALASNCWNGCNIDN